MAKPDRMTGGSLLLAEECFNAEDARFLEAICLVTAPKALAGFVDRWKKDPRPWARQQVLAYLARPLDCPGHNVVVKRLFKQAEQNRDDELMAAFLAAFDLLVRRVRKRRWRYERQSNASWEEESLVAPRNVLPVKPQGTYRNPRTGESMTVPTRIPNASRLFSYRTRYYLRRRAWRYFRRMGFQRPEKYVPAIARALAAYQDDDLAKGEHVLDSWGLVQACFRGHDALEFRASHIRLKEGRSLGQLTPAPRFGRLWQQPAAMPVLLSLVTAARSRLVRVWAMQLVKREHAGRLADLAPEELIRLLDHEDEEVQQFAADLLQNSSQLAKLPIATWLRLLKARSATALDTICQAMRRHVAADRLELADCIGLACAEPAPVAQMGFEFLKARRIASAEDCDALVALAGARCVAVAGPLTAWALGILAAPENYSRDQVLRFFDSLLRPIRRAAWEWLTREDSPGYDDPGLWCRLLESPYDDLRLALVDVLQRRASLPGASADDLAPVWCAVLLGVHRGGRQKTKAVGQIARALQRDPSRAAALLPVLAVAVRSVRLAESRAGLAAVVAAVEACPEIAGLVEKHLPELKLATGEAAP